MCIRDRNYSGVFTIEGNRIVGRIGTGPQQQTGVLQGDTIVDPNGSVWVKQKAAPPAAVSLRLPSTYVNAQADQLRLNADNSFSLQASGETYHGTFVVSGNTVELSIRETGDKTTATIQANNNLKMCIRDSRMSVPVRTDRFRARRILRSSSS